MESWQRTCQVLTDSIPVEKSVSPWTFLFINDVLLYCYKLKAFSDKYFHISASQCADHTSTLWQDATPRAAPGDCAPGASAQSPGQAPTRRNQVWTHYFREVVEIPMDRREKWAGKSPSHWFHLRNYAIKCGKCLLARGNFFIFGYF